MASQPANETIQVFRRLRTYRKGLRQESVKNLTHRLRSLVFSIPGREVYTEVKTRDTSVADLSPFMGEAAAGATRGFPVVVGAKEAKNFETIETLTGVDFPIEIGADRFVGESEDVVGDNDLHQDLRDA